MEAAERIDSVQHATKEGREVLPVEALILLVLPWAPVIEDRVDICELNRVVCERTNEPRLVQYIWWDFYCYDGHASYWVRDWRLCSDVDAKPRKTPDGWRLEWYDPRTKKRRAVVARVFVEKYSDTDRELENRAFVPCEKRRTLK